MTLVIIDGGRASPRQRNGVIDAFVRAVAYYFEDAAEQNRFRNHRIVLL